MNQQYVDIRAHKAQSGLCKGGKLTQSAIGSHRHSRDLFRPGLPRQADRGCVRERTLRIYKRTNIRDKILTVSTAEDNMNCQLRDITVTARDGRVSHLDQVYIRGSHVRYFIVPDMLR